MKSRTLGCLAGALVLGCGGSEPAPGSGMPASLEVVESEPAALVTVASEPVQGWTGPGGAPFEVALRTAGTAHLYRRIGLRTFDLSLRTTDPALSQFPCASCHQGQRTTGTREADVHQDVQPVHPAATGATCTNCHASTAVERLVLQNGETTTLDQAYRLCAQCHYSQVDAWAAGSHGKRLDGWRGRRVVMGCSDCHDPHRPAAEPRLPFPGPTLPGQDMLRPVDPTPDGGDNR